MKNWKLCLEKKPKNRELKAELEDQEAEEVQEAHQEEVFRIEVQEDQVDLEAHHQDQAEVDHHQAAEDHLRAILNTEDHHQVEEEDHHQDIHNTEAHHQAAQEAHKVNQTLLAEDE